MNNLFTLKRTVLIILIAVGILGTVLFCISLSRNGNDYTAEYKLYLDLKSLTDSQDIRNKLQELGIEYTIKDGSITLNDYEYIRFNQQEDNWLIDESTILTEFEKLDIENLSDVSIHGNKTKDGKIVENITLVTSTGTLTKVNKQYYYLPGLKLCLYMAAYMFVTLCSVIFLVRDFINTKAKSLSKNTSD